MKFCPKIIFDKNIITNDGTLASWPKNLIIDKNILESKNPKDEMKTPYSIHDSTLIFPYEQAIELFTHFLGFVITYKNLNFICGDIEIEWQDVIAIAKWSNGREVLQSKTRAILKFETTIFEDIFPELKQTAK